MLKAWLFGHAFVVFGNRTPGVNVMAAYWQGSTGGWCEAEWGRRGAGGG